MKQLSLARPMVFVIQECDADSVRVTVAISGMPDTGIAALLDDLVVTVRAVGRVAKRNEYVPPAGFRFASAQRTDGSDRIMFTFPLSFDEWIAAAGVEPIEIVGSAIAAIVVADGDPKIFGTWRPGYDLGIYYCRA